MGAVSQPPHEHDGAWGRSISAPKARKNGVRFRNDIVAGAGGKQTIAEDPSGNPVELFEPARPEARLH